MSWEYTLAILSSVIEGSTYFLVASYGFMLTCFRKRSQNKHLERIFTDPWIFLICRDLHCYRVQYSENTPSPIFTSKVPAQPTYCPKNKENQSTLCDIFSHHLVYVSEKFALWFGNKSTTRWLRVWGLIGYLGVLCIPYMEGISWYLNTIFSLSFTLPFWIQGSHNLASWLCCQP
jgi:hypothetical protein